jgi:pimeloyl-ACP methyl ester carboxylesterase
MMFVLVHSPLVSPATWRWVAEVLRRLGHEAVVPDLTVAATAGDPHAVIRAARPPTATDTPVIVGHSGAGFLLPWIAASAGSPPRRLVFVDAGVPPCEGDATAGANVLDGLRGLAVDGILPIWSRWWGEGAMETLVADEARRNDVDAELPEVPLAFYETPMTIPAGWCGTPGAFVLLSEAYRQDATTATALGWRVVELPGGHLDIVNHPEAIGRTLVDLVD